MHSSTGPGRQRALICKFIGVIASDNISMGGINSALVAGASVTSIDVNASFRCVRLFTTVISWEGLGWCIGRFHRSRLLSSANPVGVSVRRGFVAFAVENHILNWARFDSASCPRFYRPRPWDSYENNKACVDDEADAGRMLAKFRTSVSPCLFLRIDRNSKYRLTLTPTAGNRQAPAPNREILRK